MSVKSNYHSGAPYAFVSYSHKDEVVIQAVEKVQEVFNLWWDDLLIAGDRWDSERVLPAIADPNCKCILAFYSENYVQSEACQNEVSAALKNGKKIIPISVEGLSLNEIILKTEKKLNDTVKLNNVHKMCINIGGGEKSTSGNKVLFVSLTNQNYMDDFCKVLEHYLEPEASISKWLKTSYEYRIKERLEELIEDFDDYEQIGALYEEEASDYAVGSNTYAYIMPLLARFKYAIKNRFKNTNYPEEGINEVKSEMCFDYGFDESIFDDDDEFDYNDFAVLLYRCVTDIPLLCRYMKNNSDYASGKDSEDFRKNVIEWMNSRHLYYANVEFEADSSYYDCTYENLVGYIAVMENFMMYIERTYPKVVKLLMN